jgi:GspD-like, N0 domain
LKPLGYLGAVSLVATLATAWAGGGTGAVSSPPLSVPPPATVTAPTPAPLPTLPSQTAPASVAQVPIDPTTPPATSPAPRAPAEVRPSPPEGGPTPAAGRSRPLVLNFDNAEIEAVIQAVSEIVPFNYTIGPGVAGKKVTVRTSGLISEDDVFAVLLAVLEVNGVTAIRSGNLYKIVPLAAARERPVPTIVGPTPTRPGATTR